MTISGVESVQKLRLQITSMEIKHRDQTLVKGPSYDFLDPVEVSAGHHEVIHRTSEIC